MHTAFYNIFLKIGVFKILDPNPNKESVKRQNVWPFAPLKIKSEIKFDLCSLILVTYTSNCNLSIVEPFN